METVLISGGFDPIHKGHIELIKGAAKYGRIIVALNSDAWLIRKKGYCFMLWEERASIILAIKGVFSVVRVHDEDNTVRNALSFHRPNYFANGGDRTDNNVPELEICEKLKIMPLFNIGGEKIQSSSKLIKNSVMLNASN